MCKQISHSEGVIKRDMTVKLIRSIFIAHVQPKRIPDDLLMIQLNGVHVGELIECFIFA